MEFKESKTYANLMAAYAGESQARVKYELFCAQAKKEGFEQIGNLFTETSDNEKAHAKLWLQYIYGGTLPATLQALEDGAAGEHYEWSEMYKDFAQTAKEEGYNTIAKEFELVAGIEHEHEQRYLALKENVEQGHVFKKVGPNKWQCINCGFIYEGPEAPKICPVCKYPQAFFQTKAENY